MNKDFSTAEELAALVKEIINAPYDADKKEISDKIKAIYTFFASLFDCNIFPFPILTETVSCKVNSRNLINKKFMLDGSGNYHYYLNPITREKYANIQEIIDNVGTNFAIFPEYVSTECYYKYSPQFDVIVGYHFIPGSGERYRLETIDLMFRKSARVTDIVRFEKHNDEYLRRSAWHHPGYSRSSIIFNGPYGSSESFAVALKKMYGTTIMRYRANDYISLVKDYAQFYNSHFSFEKKNTRKQKLIDELSTIELPKIRVKKFAKDFINGSQMNYAITSICNVKENVSVLRWTEYDPVTKTQSDGLRIYWIDGKFVSCARNENGEFIEYPVKNLALKNFESDYMLDIKEEDVAGTTFQYYWEVINSLPVSARSSALLLFILEPQFERLAKAGFANYIGKWILRKSKGLVESIKDGIKVDVNQKNLNKYVGMNKNQIDIYNKLLTEQHNSDILNLICNVKTSIFHKNDISDIDDVTFKKVVSAFAKDDVYYQFHDFNNITNILLTRNKDTFKSFIDNVLPKLTRKNAPWRSTSFYLDYLRMVDDLNMFGQCKISFNTFEELNKMHDEISHAYNIKKNAIESAKFAKQVAKIKKFEYSNEKMPFQVVAPKVAEDVAREGIELSHCVKSYIPRIANGSTNIIFIRKKEDLDKPFFTVEISNENSIEQVHGFGNRNADTEPGMIEFVKKWAKDKKLKLQNFNKVR